MTVLIAAGGTGGHVYPALAVAEWLRARGARVIWLGTTDGIESRLVPAAGFELHELKARGLRGKGIAGWLEAPIMIAAAVLRALAMIRRERPHVVLGMGGYVSGPGGIAGRLLGLPLVVHEQNAIPGLTNRVLARIASRVLEAFPHSFAARSDAIHVGNPVRDSIAQLPPPAERLAGRTGGLRLLVLGGSQGARALNQVLPATLSALGAELQAQVRHQAGDRELDLTHKAYAHEGVEADVCAFIEDMAEAYGWADVVVCRAGAMTVTELSAAGVASVLVPFPFAVDDHQTLNARALERAGAALLVPQVELTSGHLAGVLTQLAKSRTRLVQMAEAARRLAMPDAAAAVGRCCLELAHA
ncbi:MAG: undecaprenyldiphospho-muramoylpentapeptide beta-N-acetylglucosaminyltransferase [Gammaproteobacteria bacterium]